MPAHPVEDHLASAEKAMRLQGNLQAMTDKGQDRLLSEKP